MLREDEVEAIAERARLASPGPWIFEPDGLSSAGGVAVADPTQTTGYRRVAYVAPMGVGRFGKDSRGFWKDRLRGRERETLERALANGAFIAAARSDVPALVDEIGRLRARVAELESAVLASAPPSSGVAVPGAQPGAYEPAGRC